MAHHSVHVPRPAAPPRGKWDPLVLVAGAGVMALAVGVYLGGIHNPFVYDDIVHVVQQQSIRDLSHLHELLLQDRFRPVVNLTYALDYALWGLRPLGYHLTNLMIHAINALLLMLVVLRAWGDRGRGSGPIPGAEPRHGGLGLAFTAAALLAVHPAMSEGVVYISGRAEILCATFVLASFLVLRRVMVGASSRWLLLPGLLLLALGLGTKEHAAMLPLVLLAYDRLVLGPESPGARRRLLTLHLPLVGGMLLLGAARTAMLLLVEYHKLPRPGLQNLLMQFSVIWRYLFLLAMPVNQAVVHQVRAVETLLDPVALGAGGALAALVAIALLLRRAAPLATLGVVWFLLFIAPSSSLIPLLEPMAEHRMYLAASGFFLLAAVGLCHLGRLLGRWFDLPRAAPAVGLTLILSLLGLATVTRTRVWSDPVALWTEAVQSAPRVWAPHYALGDALAAAGRCKEAVGHYRRAMEILPEEPRAYLNLGICLARLGQQAEARRVFESVLRFDPRNLRAENNLGTLDAHAGHREAARARFERVLGRDPNNVTALASLAALHEKDKEFEIAYGELGRVLRLDPHNRFALHHMIWLNAGPFDNPGEALRFCRQLKGIDPTVTGPKDCEPALLRRLAPR